VFHDYPDHPGLRASTSQEPTNCRTSIFRSVVITDDRAHAISDRLKIQFISILKTNSRQQSLKPRHSNVNPVTCLVACSITLNVNREDTIKPNPPRSFGICFNGERRRRLAQYPSWPNCVRRFKTSLPQETQVLSGEHVRGPCFVFPMAS
jgi:hypothetical protein